MPKVTFAIAAPVFTLCLLGGTWADRAMHDAGDLASGQYFQRVRQQAEALPMSIEAWLGAKAPAPPSLVKVRLPDFILSRTYRNVVTGARVDLLLVYRRDARDLIGHWPMGYVDRTWTLQSSMPSDQQVDGMTISATRHEFIARRSAGGMAAVAVDDLFILPSGRICRDVEDLGVAATALNRVARGAAQMQIVSHGRLSRQQRDEITAMFVRALRPVREAISEGVNQ